MIKAKDCATNQPLSPCTVVIRRQLLACFYTVFSQDTDLIKYGAFCPCRTIGQSNKYCMDEI
jgi:hypothetical protein